MFSASCYNRDYELSQSEMEWKFIMYSFFHTCGEILNICDRSSEKRWFCIKSCEYKLKWKYYVNLTNKFLLLRKKKLEARHKYIGFGLKCLNSHFFF